NAKRFPGFTICRIMTPRCLCYPVLMLSLATIANTALSEPLKKVLRATQLRCEYLVNPLGIDEPHPRLSWQIDADPRTRGHKQTEYQILVASKESLLEKGSGDLWDSGKIASDETVNIVYQGSPLPSRQERFWQVKIRDETGDDS